MTEVFVNIIGFWPDKDCPECQDGELGRLYLVRIGDEEVKMCELCLQENYGL